MANGHKEDCCNDCLCMVIDCFLKHQNPGGGRPACFIQASDSENQLIDQDDEAQLVRHGTVDGSSFMHIDNETTFVIEKPGTYFMIAAPQVGKGPGGIGNFRCWWRLNGTNVPNSNVMLNLHGGVEGSIQDVIPSQGAMRLQMGDELEVWMATSNTGADIGLEAITTTAEEPLVPSIITTIHSI